VESSQRFFEAKADSSVILLQNAMQHFMSDEATKYYIQDTSFNYLFTN